MKSERRHELQHNVLADWLATSFESLKPYQNMMFAAATLLVILVAAYAWWSRDAAERNTVAWDELGAAVDAGNPTLMSKVIDDRPGTVVAEMAAVVEGDQHLAIGCEQLFVNKATAQQELAKAVELYSSVRGQTRLPSLQERATYGLARAKEAKGDADDLKQALDLYEEVAKLPSGAFVAAAGQRADDLKRQSTKQLYDRFALFDPKPAFSPGQGDRPSMDMNSLPKDGPIVMPDASATERKPDEKPPEQAAPAETKPADEKMPSDEAKPVEEKKASEEPPK
jgi:hypothetical protein